MISGGIQSMGFLHRQRGNTIYSLTGEQIDEVADFERHFAGA